MYNDHEKINDIYAQLLNFRSKLDRWFNKYLDMFDEKLNSSTRTDPVWKLYRAKSEQYSDVAQIIKTVEYYLRKI